MNTDDDNNQWNVSTEYNIGQLDSTITAGDLVDVSCGDNWSTGVNSVIQTDSLEIKGVDVGEFMESINQLLLILQDNFEKHEKYPGLKDLYEQYKMMEKLLGANE